MVEHLLWEQGVVGSNPATPTRIKEGKDKGKKRRSLLNGGREVQYILQYKPDKTGAGPFH